MKKRRLQIFVEDYNVPMTPWLWLNEFSFKDDLPDISQGEVSFDSLFIFEKDFVIWAADQKQFEAGGEYFKKVISKNSGFLRKIIDGHYKAFGEFDKIRNYFSNHDLKKEKDKNLFKIYRDYAKWVRYCFKWGMVIQILDMGSVKYSDEVKQRLMPKLKKIGNPEIAFGQLITPLHQSFVAKEIDAILKLATKIKKNHASLADLKQADKVSDLSLGLRKELNRLTDGYGWLQFYYLGPAASPEYYLDLLKRKIEGEPAKELQFHKEEAGKLKLFQIQSRKLFTNNELAEVNALREFMNLKEARKEQQIYRMNYVMSSWYKEVGRRLQISPLQARYITLPEYERILETGTGLDVEMLNQRYNLCASLLKNGEIKLLIGREAEQCKKLLAVSKELGKAKELRGSVAYPGKVQGIVKIVNSTKDIGKFDEGDILVSYSTNPSLVPAMNKARAIITNTGGVTCHAAIVSRELKTPCIIGTGAATKVLRDGDRVEVDADAGVVKILKRNEKRHR
jgi:phosphohistidine swiveling domain-containing protein